MESAVITSRAESSAVSPIDPAPSRRSLVEAAPLRVKVTALIIAGISGGMVLGVLVSQMQDGALWLPLGLTSLILLLTTMAARWVWRPIEDLVQTVGRISRSEKPTAIGSLPLKRVDEVGALARALHQLTAWAIRDNREAHLMRKTLDSRVADATRKATLQLRRLAMRDALTDLGNRHFLDDHLDPLVESVSGGPDELSCLVFDVDNFKRVNDTLGHAAGDELLILIGSLIRATVRHSDYAVRLGGDEFVVLMPCANADCVELLAQRIRSLFRQHAHTTLGAAMEVDLSMGIASFKSDGLRTGRDLIDVADRRLYDNKRARKAKRAAAAG